MTLTSTPSAADFDAMLSGGAGRIIKDHVDPWLHLRTQGFRGQYPDGRVIAYEGIDFVGSPRDTFWSDSYVLGYLREFIDGAVAETAACARERGDDVGIVLHDLSSALGSSVGRVLGRMADVDRRLRGKGFPDSVSQESVDERLSALSAYANARISRKLVAEKDLARTMMIGASEKGSALIDTYSSWLLAGFAAFVAAAIANKRMVEDLISSTAIAILLFLLGLIALLGIVQKALAVLVASQSAGNRVGRDLAGRGEVSLGFSVVAQEVLKGVLPWAQGFARRRLVRAFNGDLAADGRSIFRMAQYQSILVTIQVLLIFFTIVWMGYESLPGDERRAKARVSAAENPKPATSLPKEDAVGPR